jgi:hypothetical protein
MTDKERMRVLGEGRGGEHITKNVVKGGDEQEEERETDK